jgi:hypothetical protein
MHQRNLRRRGDIHMILEVKDIITLSIAGYGALLSTFNLLQSIMSTRKLIKVDCQWGIEFDGGTNERVLTFTIVNHGARPVVVNAPMIVFPGGMLEARGEGSKFPRALKDGEIAVVKDMPLKRVIENLKLVGLERRVVVRTSCTSSTGQIYFGNSLVIDMERGDVGYT